jgi:hypothetical protein
MVRILRPSARDPEWNEQQPLYVPLYRAPILYGSFVMVAAGWPGERLVCRLLRRLPNNNMIEFQIYRRLFPKGETCRFPVSPIIQSPAKHFEEVYGTRVGLQFHPYDENFIKSICFVLTPDEISGCHHWSVGNAKTFVIRFEESNDGQELVPINTTFTCFPSRSLNCQYGSCFHWNVFTGLGQISKVVTSLLNRRAESQGDACHASASINVSSDCQNYIIAHTEQDAEAITSHKSSCHTDPALVRKKSIHVVLFFSSL